MNIFSKQFVLQHQQSKPKANKKITNFAPSVSFVETILIPKNIFTFNHPEFEFM